jgi:hypothetical protein
VFRCAWYPSIGSAFPSSQFYEETPDAERLRGRDANVERRLGYRISLPHCIFDRIEQSMRLANDGLFEDGIAYSRLEASVKVVSRRRYQ